MPVLQGTFYSSVDAKSRVAVPARHREVLQAFGEGNLVGTVHHREPCLVLRPSLVWNTLAERLREIPNTDPSVQQLLRKILGNAQDLNPDTNGRILLSPALREYAGLKGSQKVAVVGMGEYLEIWDAKVWDEQMKREVDLGAEVLRDLRL